jgi:cytochrome c peroxidase
VKLVSSYFKMEKLVIRFFLGSAVLLLQQCKKDPSLDVLPLPDNTNKTTPYVITIPAGFPTVLNTPANNPLTVEGIALGKKLFYDPILSGDNTMSCGTCHAQAFNFSDHNKQFSTGITGAIGTRNTQALVNLAWNPVFFWDGRAATIEEQVLGPVANPIEMHLSWPTAVTKIQSNAEYPDLFDKAFQTKTVTQDLITKAIAQFERTMISANSRFDRWRVNKDTLSLSEQRGYDLFYTEQGDCFHCHTTQLFTDNLFHNNGLDAFPSDSGRAKVTKSPNDVGKFKTPTLRNIALSAPYMHDGRFTTLEEVVDFYSSGLQFSATVDPLMKKLNLGGAQLNAQEKQDLINFLRTLTDQEYITNTAYSP